MSQYDPTPFRDLPTVEAELREAERDVDAVLQGQREPTRDEAMALYRRYERLAAELGDLLGMGPP